MPLRAAPRRDERVLHVHLSTSEETNEPLCRALASLGDYQRIDWMRHDYNGRQKAIIDATKEFRPTLVWMQIQASGILAPETLAEVRRIVPYAVIVTWCGDVGNGNGPFE